MQLIITSPPYWQLKDYGTEDQIGFNDSYEEYINNLNLVWKECNRVLSDGYRLCINIGDQFARSVYYGRYKVIPIRTEIIRFCESLGMDYMGAIIWQKTTTMNTSGGSAIMGSFPYPRNGILKMDYEFILLFKKSGNAPKPTQQQKEQSAMTKEEWSQYFSSHWNFNGAKQMGHIAMFPEELPKRLIKMFSFSGETVFDPFAGSGTTSLAAKNLGRNSIGYEINRDFKPIIREKLGVSQLTLGDDAKVIFAEDDIGNISSFEQLTSMEKYPFERILWRMGTSPLRVLGKRSRCMCFFLEGLQIAKTAVFINKSVLIVVTAALLSIRCGFSNKACRRNIFHIYLNLLTGIAHPFIRLWNIFRVWQLDWSTADPAQQLIQPGDRSGVSTSAKLDPEYYQTVMRVPSAHIFYQRNFSLCVLLRMAVRTVGAVCQRVYISVVFLLPTIDILTTGFAADSSLRDAVLHRILNYCLLIPHVLCYHIHSEYGTPALRFCLVSSTLSQVFPIRYSFFLICHTSL